MGICLGMLCVSALLLPHPALPAFSCLLHKQTLMTFLFFSLPSSAAPGIPVMERERVIIELLKNVSADQVWPVLVWIKQDFLGSIPELWGQGQQSSSTFYTPGSWFRVFQKWEIMALELNWELRWVSAAEVFRKALGREVVHWSWVLPWAHWWTCRVCPVHCWCHNVIFKVSLLARSDSPAVGYSQCKQPADIFCGIKLYLPGDQGENPCANPRCLGQDVQT